MSPISLCASCLKPSTLVCTQCDNIGYCSETCQTTDKSSHQIVCHAFQNFSDNQRPNPCSKDGFLLPSSTANPQSVWLDTNKKKHNISGVEHYSQGLYGAKDQLSDSDDVTEGSA
ncbi:hypothetical protein VTO58DRAFT_106229 [Aureobasidium pullulans]